MEPLVGGRYVLQERYLMAPAGCMRCSPYKIGFTGFFSMLGSCGESVTRCSGVRHGYGLAST